jgi:hypothetical protein
MKNKALLIGINKYPDPRNELRGCVNDILDMEHFITESNKVYQRENIKKLTDKDATKKGIITQIKWLVEGVQPGDQILLHYSGHGAQVPTMNGTVEKDGLDEVICPYNFNGSNDTILRDKEFAQLFSGIPKGVHFIWISDSCHAEDLSRDPKMAWEGQYRYFMGAKEAYNEAVSTKTESYQDNATRLENVINTSLNGALLSACASHELSADAFINNRYNGAFTYYLIKNLLEYGNSKPMDLIIKLVNSDLANHGYDQNPQTEGLLENKGFFI